MWRSVRLMDPQGDGDGSESISAIAAEFVRFPVCKTGHLISVTYYPEINRYQGRKHVGDHSELLLTGDGCCEWSNQ